MRHDLQSAHSTFKVCSPTDDTYGVETSEIRSSNSEIMWTYEGHAVRIGDQEVLPSESLGQCAWESSWDVTSEPRKEHNGHASRGVTSQSLFGFTGDRHEFSPSPSRGQTQLATSPSLDCNRRASNLDQGYAFFSDASQPMSQPRSSEGFGFADPLWTSAKDQESSSTPLWTT